MNWRRRKGLCKEFGFSLRKVDYIIRDMRESGLYDRYIIKNDGFVLVDAKAFERYLRGRNEGK